MIAYREIVAVTNDPPFVFHTVNDRFTGKSKAKPDIDAIPVLAVTQSVFIQLADKKLSLFPVVVARSIEMWIALRGGESSFSHILE